MLVEERIAAKLTEACSPQSLQVINESHMHAGPATDSHFKVVLVSERFDGQRLLQRHRQVNQVLAAELAAEVHALAMHTYTPAEWQAEQQQFPESPRCAGHRGQD